jgi:hypothetical protein
MDPPPLATMYPTIIEIDYPERLSRGLIFVKWLLVLQHYIVLAGYAIICWVAAVAALVAILFTGNVPEGLWDFILGFDRWSLRVSAYLFLMTDEYPPFTNQDVAYPVRLRCGRPSELSRGLPFIKWLLALPHLILLIFIGIAAFIVVIIAWFAILFTGKFPKGLFTFVEGYLRWETRVAVYCGHVRVPLVFIGYNPYLGGLLRDEYPPFSLKGDPTPAVAPSSPGAGADIPPSTADYATPPLSLLQARSDHEWIRTRWRCVSWQTCARRT